MLAACLSLKLTACAASPPPSEPIRTELKCPPLAPDIAAEGRKKPALKGDTAAEMVGNLILQGHAKNSAISRAIASYEACRRTNLYNMFPSLTTKYVDYGRFGKAVFFG